MVCFANPANAGFGKPNPQLSASGKSAPLAVLELIHNTLFIDRCALYTLDFVSMLQQGILNGKENYASDIAKKNKSVQKQIDKAVSGS